MKNSFYEINFGRPDNFTYTWHEPLSVGQIVRAPLRKQTLTGIVVKVLQNEPNFPTKGLTEITKLALHPASLTCAHWLSTYYQAPFFKCLGLWLPSALWSKPQHQTQTYIRLLQPDFEPPKSAKKQLALLTSLRENPFQPLTVPKSMLKSLLEKKVVELTEEPLASPTLPALTAKSQDFKLTDEQTQALEMLRTDPEKPFLLHGITGSGKTALYRQLAEDTLAQQKTVLILVPEIALTGQLLTHFAGILPAEQIGIWHSGLTDGERAHLWTLVAEQKIKLIIGSRSALFLPYMNLGLIVVDEEHEWTYKQDQSPRYDTRTVVEKIAELYHAKLIFGSATPRITTYYRAQQGELTLVELRERATTAPKVEFEIVDLRPEARKDFNMLSSALLDELADTLERGEQALLFLNRRGYSSHILCYDCGQTLKCPHCDLALTHHANSEKEILLCHLCGYFQPPTGLCPSCGSPNLHYLGTGTEKLERELKRLFPEKKILRADRDTIKHHTHFHAVYESMQDKSADILLGTQMIAQGLDFPQVNLVGILLADSGLSLPDFGASERVFQLLTQVSGRAGRHTAGKVIVQTFNPDHSLFVHLAQNDYKKFYDAEITIRQAHHFPPFSTLAKITVVNPDKAQAYKLAQNITNQLKPLLAPQDEIFSAPALPPLQHKKYHWQVVLFASDPATLIGKISLPNGARVDIEPVSTL